MLDQLIEKINKLALKFECIDCTPDKELEAVKYGLVLPFLKVLDYDVFNTEDVEIAYAPAPSQDQEATADFAIRPDKNVQIVVEATDRVLWKTTSSKRLRKTYNNSDATVAILTNGTRYLFFTDIETNGQLDREPYMEMDIEWVANGYYKKRMLEHLLQLSKWHYHREEVKEGAFKLKFYRKVNKYLKRQLYNPNRSFIQFIKQHSTPNSLEAQLEYLKNQFEQADKEFINFILSEIGADTSSKKRAVHDIVNRILPEISVEKYIRAASSSNYWLLVQESQQSADGLADERKASKEADFAKREKQVEGTPEQLDSKGSADPWGDADETTQQEATEKTPPQPTESQELDRDNESPSDSSSEEEPLPRNTSGNDYLSQERIEKQRELTKIENNSHGDSTNEVNVKEEEEEEEESKESVKKIFGQGMNPLDEAYEILQDIASDVTNIRNIEIREEEDCIEMRVGGNEDIIARVRVEDNNKQLGLFDSYGEEYQISLNDMDDIYDFDDQIKITIQKAQKG